MNEDTLVEEAECRISYWEIHGDNPEAVGKWAVTDLLALARRIVREEA